MSHLLKDNKGFATILTLVIVSILAVLGATFASIVILEIRFTSRILHMTQAFYLAEAAENKAVNLIRNDAIESFPYSENDVSLGNGQYSLQIEEETGQAGAYHRKTYTITGAGEASSIESRVRSTYKQDTFLRFSRFIQYGDLDYGSNALISGCVWVGNDLNLQGYPVTFMRDVSVGGVINNYSNGIFYGGVTEGADPIDLQVSVDLAYYSDLAQGNISDEGTGIYKSSSSTMDFSLFDFSGSVPKYDGNDLTADFNGVIYVDGDAYVKGTLEGGSVTVIASDDVVVEDHVRSSNMATSWTETDSSIDFNSDSGVEEIQTVSIDDIISTDTTVVKLRTNGTNWEQMKMELLEDGDVVGETYLVRRPSSPDEQMAVISNIELDPSGHSYSAKIYYKSNGSGDNPTWVRAYEGDPVNIGLVAKDRVYIHPDTPRQLMIDAALLARDENWIALGDDLTHPDEYDSSWELTIDGPIITAVGGSAGPWCDYGIRNYNYDEDITSFPPPYFPVPLGAWVRLYWRTLESEEV